MTKKGPLSKAEKFYISNHLDLDVRLLCKDLDRAQTTVSKFVETLPKRDVVTTSKQDQDEERRIKKGAISDQFARNEAGGAIVMTPNASQMADTQRAAYRNSALVGNKRGCITTIKGDNG